MNDNYPGGFSAGVFFSVPSNPKGRTMANPVHMGGLTISIRINFNDDIIVEAGDQRVQVLDGDVAYQPLRKAIEGGGRQKLTLPEKHPVMTLLTKLFHQLN
jgi:hypothetical protein